MNISIKNNNFGDFSENLRILLKDVHNTLNESLKYKNNKFDINIKVTHNSNDYYPMVYYQKEDDGSILVNLGLYNKDWARYVYQFAHEYCHIRTNYTKGREKYLWFEESVCEVASHYALRKMSKNWQKKPPYKNWKDYAINLKKYSDNIFSMKDLSEEDFKSFIQNNLSVLENGNPCDHRTEYKVIAKHLITYFEKSPNLWKAMTYWNKWDLNNSDTIKEAFTKWLNILPEELKKETKELIDAFQL